MLNSPYCILICIFDTDKGPCSQNPVHSSDFIGDLTEDTNPAWTFCITLICATSILLTCLKKTHKMLKSQCSSLQGSGGEVGPWQDRCLNHQPFPLSRYVWSHMAFSSCHLCEQQASASLFCLHNL